jgi:hypothetical protein
MWGMQLNQFQVRTVQNNAIVDHTQHVATVTAADIQGNLKMVGIARIAGCYIHRANVELNGIPMDGTNCTVIADSNSTTCVVRVTINAAVTVENDKLLIRCVWKTGNNPLGVAAQVEAVIGAEDMG